LNPFCLCGRKASPFEAGRPAVEKLGGKVELGWLAFGEHDIESILQMSDNVNAETI
jgi:uncharacterized protein with GYD domain